jgi:hypothetical protein
VPEFNHCSLVIQGVEPVINVLTNFILGVTVMLLELSFEAVSRRDSPAA